MKTAARRLPAAPVLKPEALHRFALIVDGNAHRSDLCGAALPDTPHPALSEALIPQIRTVATLIAAARHDFGSRSPGVFTEEADFFAARILVLGARRFHLDITLVPMLNTANRRAREFAQRHGLPFAPAEIRMSLNAGRPANLLIIESCRHAENIGSLVENSRAFAANLPFAV
ncbi:hypothetical protein [Neisseria chenwenguii]|uniref:Uncharacterized protein n=1 Tax=Neisseria chenwenguii TaxID=1853278 RepID=A0A220S4F9_9NEIS|nr:hypothetical protein [Neisseria chenwenguii]ASK28330.1 hypothetical protein BG910_11820 [Neisseria chenwenguii]ROV55445.1 hypothetical protein EGS38_09590 [Neisseria chenwenguii]